MVHNVLLVIGFLHHKNMSAIKKYNNINFTTVSTIEECNDLSLYDAVFSPSTMIDVSKYPNSNFIFGPHFSVFPSDFIYKINGPNTIYIQPSQWVIDFWKQFPICKDLKMSALPFGVDTERFTPDKQIHEKNNVIIYFKRRKVHELNYITNYLSALHIPYRVFDYVQSYSESDYIDYLKSSKYGIWLDAHESQGFATAEALSCNVPLLVWNVTSMNQEDGCHYPDIPATSIGYWGESCGEVFHNYMDFESTFHLFLSKLHTYCPREYIVNHLSIEKCEEKFINLLSAFSK